MAQVLGKSGRYVADQVQLKRWQSLRIAFAAVAITFTIEGFFLATIFPGPPLPLWSKVLIILAGLVAVLAVLNSAERRMKQLEKERNDFQRGEQGETTVGRLLANLTEDFYVINGLSTPFGDLDHVVVGPTGVFVMDTKSWQ